MTTYWLRILALISRKGIETLELGTDLASALCLPRIGRAITATDETCRIRNQDLVSLSIDSLSKSRK